jgi:predicted neuraminidase
MKELDHLNRRTFLIRSALAAAVIPPMVRNSNFGPAATVNEPSANATAPRLVSKSMIFKHPSADPYDCANLYGFNHATSVTALPDGRLMAAWFSGPFEAAVNQVILSSVSSDKGSTWSPAAVLQDTPRKSDFDPAFLVDGKRVWFFYSVGRWNRYPFIQPQKDEIGIDSFKLFRRYSDDSGRTWSEPVMLLEKLGTGCRSNGIRLSSGELVLPLHGYMSNEAGVLKSDDHGATWRRIGGITSAAGAAEPSIAEVAPGELMMVLRTGDGFIWQVFSRDKGDTWTAPEKTSIVAARSSHNLFRLPDGRIALTHNPTKNVRAPLTTRISDDRGKTWGEPLVIADAKQPGKDDEAWGRQVSYPSVAAIDSKTIIAVWGDLYLSNSEQYGDVHSARIAV